MRLLPLRFIGTLAVACAIGATPAQTQGSARGTVRRSPFRWTFAAVGTGQSESNVYFSSENPVSDIATSVGVAAGGELASPRSSLTLGGTADVRRYQTAKSLDRINADVGVRSTSQLSRRLQGELDVQFRTASSLDRSPGLAETELFLIPFARVSTWSGVARATMRLTARTDAVLESDVARTRFSDPLIPGGERATAQASIRHLLSAHRTLGFMSDVTMATTGEQSLRVVTVGAVMSGSSGPWGYRLLGGAAGIRTGSAERETFAPLASGELRRGARGQSVTLQGSSGPLETFGFGRPLVQQQFDISLQRLLFASVDLRTSAGAGWITDPTVDGLDLRATTLLAEVRRPMGSASWIAMSAFKRRLVGQLSVESVGWTLGVGVGRSR